MAVPKTVAHTPLPPYVTNLTVSLVRQCATRDARIVELETQLTSALSEKDALRAALHQAVHAGHALTAANDRLTTAYYTQIEVNRRLRARVAGSELAAA